MVSCVENKHKKTHIKLIEKDYSVIAGTEVGGDEERFIKRCRRPVLRWIHSEDLMYSTEIIFEMC